jgi:Zn-finger nucleic acid-binding protein
LHAIAHGELQARWCEGCGGVWLDLVACQKLRRAFESGFLTRLGRVTARAADVDLVPPIECPVCNERLRRERLHDLDLDACVGHGMWFDKWELSEVVHAEMTPEPRSRDVDGIESLLAELRSRA